MIPEARTQFRHTYNMWLLHQTKQHLSWVHLKPTVNLIWLSFVYLIKEKYLISRGFITQRRIPSHLIVHLSNYMMKCCSLAWNHAPHGVTHEDFSIMSNTWRFFNHDNIMDCLIKYFYSHLVRQRKAFQYEVQSLYFIILCTSFHIFNYNL